MTKTKKDKLFVLDTNIPSIDPACFLKFSNQDVTFLLDVISELDKAKKYTDTVGFNARETTRLLDKFFEPALFKDGVSMGPNKGKLSIYFLKELHPEVKKAFKEDTVDNRIISVALNLKTQYPDKEIILVSNDTGLRFKAASLGIKVEVYQNDRVENLDDLYKGVVTINSNEEKFIQLINDIYQNNEILIKDIKPYNTTKFSPNQYLILQHSSGKSVLCRRVMGEKIQKVTEKTIYGKLEAKNAEQKFAIDALFDKDISLVTMGGSAGTGKTLLAVAAAIRQADKYSQIFISRPIVALSNKDLGYLPGDVQSKIEPYMQPIWDNIRFIKHQCGGENKKKSREIDEIIEEKITIEALAYIRGRTLPNTLFIVDEAQNLTPNEVKTIVTRMGEGSKVIFTGDVDQIDHPYLDTHSNGFSYLVERSKNYEKAAHVYLKKGERSDLSDWGAKNL
jgi:PhoH-like ATPase